ncbi:unnamed protein product [Protopolystoma xenopodis]|uniref:Fucosyltransferase n=1 Tax=Protopolystoma xenopodis TaxID=117903 RepID=A0A3S5CB21_9PLAT|nr:unnamed protein product [Protopolystoma xenopodis]
MDYQPPETLVYFALYTFSHKAKQKVECIVKYQNKWLRGQIELQESDIAFLGFSIKRFFYSLCLKMNFTMSYRLDSTIVTPYYKYTPFDLTSRTSSSTPTKNYAARKTKKIAWFVSNCGANSPRLQYAKVLAKYIQVCLKHRLCLSYHDSTSSSMLPMIISCFGP